MLRDEARIDWCRSLGLCEVLSRVKRQVTSLESSGGYEMVIEIHIHHPGRPLTATVEKSWWKV